MRRRDVAPRGTSHFEVEDSVCLDTSKIYSIQSYYTLRKSNTLSSMSTTFLDLACLVACRFPWLRLLGSPALSVGAGGATLHFRPVGGVLRELGGANAAPRGICGWSCTR